MHRSGRKSKLSERDRRTLNRIVREDPKSTVPKITAEFNEHLKSPVSTKTVRRQLHKSEFHGRAAIRKPLLSKTNISKRLAWCRNLQNWFLEQFKIVIFSDESSFTLFLSNVRLETAERCISSRLLSPNRKTWYGSMRTWGSIS